MLEGRCRGWRRRRRRRWWKRHWCLPGERSQAPVVQCRTRAHGNGWSGKKLTLQAQVTMHHAHHAPCTPCTMHHAPCTMHHAPCTMHHAPCTMHHAPCTDFAVQPARGLARARGEGQVSSVFKVEQKNTRVCWWDQYVHEPEVSQTIAALLAASRPCRRCASVAHPKSKHPSNSSPHLKRSPGCSSAACCRRWCCAAAARPSHVAAAEGEAATGGTCKGQKGTRRPVITCLSLMCKIKLATKPAGHRREQHSWQGRGAPRDL